MGIAASGRALDVLEDVLDRPEQDRELWLTARHGDDPELVDSVRRLLARAAGGHAALPTEPPEPRPVDPDRPPPERIGAYRLTERLGEGGMGVVWRGERDDGLFEHVIAAKLIRGARLDPRTAARFVVERRALARVSHPGIARLLDGGVTPDGEPYILMDYVEGAPVTDAVLRRDLDARATVALMRQVCDAVAAAHRALVVHGDIKPSNVLVTPDGDVRLLDFGVARLLETDAALEAAMPITAAYASPERRAGEPPGVADDVYALGMLLRELLARAGPTLAGRTPRPLHPDLAAVADRATATAPEHRYGGADALAADLRRWGEGRPVEARGASRVYAARRYVGRHPLATAAAAAAVVALTATAVVTSTLYVQAEAARRDADRRFADARGMANYLLFDIFDRLQSAPRTLAVRRDLAATGQRYLDRLATDERAPVDVQVEAVRGLTRLGSVQGGGRGPALGDTTQARRNLDAAVALGDRLTREHPDRGDLAVALGEARLTRAILVMEVQGDPAEASREIAAAQIALRRAEAAQADPVAVGHLAVDVELQAASLASWQARYDDCVAAGRRAIAAIGRLPPSERDAPKTRMREMRAWEMVGEGEWYAGRLKAAVEPYEFSLAIMQDLAARRPEDQDVRRGLASAQWGLGTTLISVDRSTEALPILADSVRNAEIAAAFDPEDTYAERTVKMVRQAYAQGLAGVGRLDEAIDLMRRDIVDRRAAAAKAGPDTAIRTRDLAVSTASLAQTYVKAGRMPEACRTYAEAYEVWEGLNRRGQVAALDRDTSIKGIVEDARRHCPALQLG